MQPHSVTPYGSQSPCQNCAAGVANRMHHQPTHTHTAEGIPTRSAALHDVSYNHSKQPHPTTPKRPTNARTLCMQPEPCAILVTGTRRVAYAHTHAVRASVGPDSTYQGASTCDESQPVCAPHLSCTIACQTRRAAADTPGTSGYGRRGVCEVKQPAWRETAKVPRQYGTEESNRQAYNAVRTWNGLLLQRDFPPHGPRPGSPCESDLAAAQRQPDPHTVTGQEAAGLRTSRTPLSHPARDKKHRVDRQAQHCSVAAWTLCLQEHTHPARSPHHKLPTGDQPPPARGTVHCKPAGIHSWLAIRMRQAHLQVMHSQAAHGRAASKLPAALSLSHTWAGAAGVSRQRAQHADREHVEERGRGHITPRRISRDASLTVATTGTSTHQPPARRIAPLGKSSAAQNFTDQAVPRTAVASKKNGRQPVGSQSSTSPKKPPGSCAIEQQPHNKRLHTDGSSTMAAPRRKAHRPKSAANKGTWTHSTPNRTSTDEAALLQQGSHHPVVVWTASSHTS